MGKGDVMNIETYRMPPQTRFNRTAAAETVKSGDRESSLADSRSFSDDEDKSGKEQFSDIDERAAELEKKLVALNIKLAAIGLNVRYTYSIIDNRIEITVRDSTNGLAIRNMNENELDMVELRLAEMSGLLIDYNM